MNSTPLIWWKCTWRILNFESDEILFFSFFALYYSSGRWNFFSRKHRWQTDSSLLTATLRFWTDVIFVPEFANIRSIIVGASLNNENDKTNCHYSWLGTSTILNRTWREWLRLTILFRNFPRKHRQTKKRKKKEGWHDRLKTNRKYNQISRAKGR